MADNITGSFAFAAFNTRASMKHYTRFRAYQLPNKGSSFSLSVDNHFTLIEARYNETNKEHILWELNLIKRTAIDVLHITSWDDDHCNFGELCNLLNDLSPSLIEYPSEVPTTENGRKSRNAILEYAKTYVFCKAVSITPYFVKNEPKEPLTGRNLFYNPLINGDKSNNNSVVKFFRVGSFQILSLGDCEDSSIAQRLMKDPILKDEVDIMILAHHGADNGFTTPEFLKAIDPLVCVCASNYANEYDHPKPIIRSRCQSLNIPLFTTKRGDIIAQTIDPKHFKVSNYVSNNEAKETVTPPLENKTWYKSDV